MVYVISIGLQRVLRIFGTGVTGCVGGRAVEHANKPGAEGGNRWWVDGCVGATVAMRRRGCVHAAASGEIEAGVLGSCGT